MSSNSPKIQQQVQEYGSTITTECEQADRWVEHFREILNQPQLDESADPYQQQMTPT